MAVKVVSDLHQGNGASDLLLRVGSATESDGYESVPWQRCQQRGFLGEPDHGDIENEKAYVSVLLDHIVDVTCPCTKADTLEEAPAANAPDNEPLDLACKKDRS